MISILKLLVGIVGLASGVINIQPVGDVPLVELSVVRRTSVQYYLLTREKPVVFTVGQVPDTGLWLRIYTRMFFSKPKSDTGWYFLTFTTGDSVRRMRFDTKLSSSATGPRNQPIGQWRSFYVRLRRNDQFFKIALDSGTAETIGVRIKVQKPRSWEMVGLPGAPDLNLIIKHETLMTVRSGYFQIKTNENYFFTATGPAWLRIRIRIDFTPEINGGQSYVFRLASGGKIIQERTFRTIKDHDAEYQEIKNVVPSREKQVKVKIGPGEHKLAISIGGTIAKSASIAIERLSNEKYE